MGNIVGEREKGRKDKERERERQRETERKRDGDCLVQLIHPSRICDCGRQTHIAGGYWVPLAGSRL